MAKVLRAVAMSKCIGCFTCLTVCSAANQRNHSLLKSAIHVRTKGGMEGKFVANICRACADPACAEACQTGALAKRKGGGVTFTAQKCIGCAKCEKACIADAVAFDHDTNNPIICKHCGLCTRFCPHGCLTMEDVDDAI